MDGFLLIDKEKGITSFDIIRIVRKILGEKKAGHAGTLDPLATGLVIVGLGKATKSLKDLLGMDKKYEVLAEFGYVSDSYDADGVVSPLNTDMVFGEDRLGDILDKKFTGKIEQMPPVYSALKVNGKRACDIVRAGGKVVLKPRIVTVHEFKIKEYRWPLISFEVHCGSGTYVRSLIHDLGQVLGCGAYVKELRRTSIANYSVKDAVPSERVRLDDVIPIEKFLEKMI